MEVAVLPGQPHSEFRALGSEEIQLGIQLTEGSLQNPAPLLADVFGTGMKPCMSACVCAWLL